MAPTSSSTHSPVRAPVAVAKIQLSHQTSTSSASPAGAPAASTRSLGAAASEILEPLYRNFLQLLPGYYMRNYATQSGDDHATPAIMSAAADDSRSTLTHAALYDFVKATSSTLRNFFRSSTTIKQQSGAPIRIGLVVPNGPEVRAPPQAVYGSVRHFLNL